jgi:hypothetical protein
MEIAKFKKQLKDLGVTYEQFLEGARRYYEFVDNDIEEDVEGFIELYDFQTTIMTKISWHKTYEGGHFWNAVYSNRNPYIYRYLKFCEEMELE